MTTAKFASTSRWSTNPRIIEGNGQRATDNGHSLKEITSCKPIIRWDSKSPPTTTTGRWSLTRYSPTPPMSAAVEATSVTPSRLTPISMPTLGAVQGAYRGNGDAFVTKINSAGTKLIYSTYLGGSQSDTATALALSNGSVFITGYTSSSDFPVNVAITTPPTLPFQQTYGGGSSDAFVAQLNTTGNVLVYSSYLGGSGADFGQGIAVDSSGNAYVTGSTQSTNFPITNTAPNTPYQPSLNGSQNAFVTKVNFSGEALIYSTYLGGSSADSAQAIQLDSSGNAYIAGYTFSSNFPTVAAYQSAIGGGSDA